MFLVHRTEWTGGGQLGLRYSENYGVRGSILKPRELVMKSSDLGNVCAKAIMLHYPLSPEVPQNCTRSCALFREILVGNVTNTPPLSQDRALFVADGLDLTPEEVFVYVQTIAQDPEIVAMVAAHLRNMPEIMFILGVDCAI